MVDFQCLSKDKGYVIDLMKTKGYNMATRQFNVNGHNIIHGYNGIQNALPYRYLISKTVSPPFYTTDDSDKKVFYYGYLHVRDSRPASMFIPGNYLDVELQLSDKFFGSYGQTSLELHSLGQNFVAGYPDQYLSPLILFNQIRFVQGGSTAVDVWMNVIFNGVKIEFI